MLEAAAAPLLLWQKARRCASKQFLASANLRPADTLLTRPDTPSGAQRYPVNPQTRPANFLPLGDPPQFLNPLCASHFPTESDLILLKEPARLNMSGTSSQEFWFQRNLILMQNAKNSSRNLARLGSLKISIVNALSNSAF